MDVDHESGIRKVTADGRICRTAVMRLCMVLLSLGLLVYFMTSVHAAQLQRVTERTGASLWETTTQGVYFSLTQLLPEQVRAFYVNRGFTLKQIEPYASACVFMAVLRNDTAPGTVHFVQNRWTVLASGQPLALMPVETWVTRLQNSEGITPAALIAFRWAQFPQEQRYAPGGDWNQGMLALDLPPASQFDLQLRWEVAGKDYVATLRGITCAN